MFRLIGDILCIIGSHEVVQYNYVNQPPYFECNRCPVRSNNLQDLVLGKAATAAYLVCVLAVLMLAAQLVRGIWFPSY